MNLTQLIQSRDIQIDTLRFLGLSLIFLAHVQPPEILFQLRAFDVPLMLFVSGMAFSGKKPNFSANFFISRFKRLLIPVYLFLSAYFILAFSLKTVGIDFGIRTHHIIGSYLLMDGIGYVWVIRVFLIIGLLTPLLLTLNARIKNDFLFCTNCFALFLIVTLLVTNRIGMQNIFVREFLYYALGYSVLFLLGIRFREFPIHTKISIISIAAIGTAFLQLTDTQYIIGGGITINNHKYPPEGLFILYGILSSGISAWLVKLITTHFKIPDIILFIGQNTIWIYLYHIPLTQLTGHLGLHWLPRYFIVYLLATGIVLLQNYIVHRHKIPYSRYLKG